MRDSSKGHPKSVDIDAIGSGSFEAPVDRAWLDVLRHNPEKAKKMGAAAARFHENAVKAHPGQARAPSVSVDELRQHGYNYIADQAELMGRKKL